MELDKKWGWKKEKLPIKIRSESGNPGADELRDRVAALIGMDLATFQKNLKEREEAKREGKQVDKKDEIKSKPEIVQAALRRINTSLALFGNQFTIDRPATSSEETLPCHRRNLKKKFIDVPRSPPRRALYDIKMDRVKMESTKAVKDSPQITSEDEKFDNAADPLLSPISLLDGEKHKQKGHSSFVGLIPPKINVMDDNYKNPMHEVSVRGKLFCKNYGGDLFSTGRRKNGEGMIYLSRMPSTRAKPVASQIVFQEPPKVEDIDLSDSSEESISLPSLKEIQQKLHCIKTIWNWAKYEGNADRLAHEGAVSAVLKLSKEHDLLIRKYCASTFRIMSSRPILAEQLVDSGVVNYISDLLFASGKTKQIMVDCTVALVNLTKNVGTEATLVEHGIVLTLMGQNNMEEEEWDELCARGLFNLTCVDKSYQSMDRVIKAFMTLASSTFTSVKYICASALCNIADLKNMRMRMVEEGVIQVLSVLAKGADIKTRRLCAIILYSLASNKKETRAEMALRGAIYALYLLSFDNDMTTLYCTASAIMRLTQEETNAARLVTDGGISTVSNIAIRCADVPTTSQACAKALHVLSKRPSQRSVIVQEGCVPALITMLRTSTDFLTLRYSVLAICNLLTVEDNQVHILQQGGVKTIVKLCRHEHEGIKKSCAFAIFTLSCVEAARKQATSCDAIPVIISLAKVDDDQMQMYCAATLCMMSTDSESIGVMVREKAIQTFISLLSSSNPLTVRYSCAALCCLAYNNNSCKNVLEEGAVPHVVGGSLNGDKVNRMSCCAVISALSIHSDIRQQLCNLNVLPALIALSSLNDEMTRLRCAVAFANLSCESMAQGLMVKQGVVPILSDLSNSYSEENQLYCAKALCNLACHIGSEEIIVEQGGMAALMMIGMVRTVSPQTKQICTKAMLNLLNERTAKAILDEGLVTACTSLAKLDDEHTMKSCAYMFCFISANDLCRVELIKKPAAFYSLARLLNTTTYPDTKRIVGKTICNLMGSEDSRSFAVEEGGVGLLKEIAMLGDPEGELMVMESFFRILASGSKSCRARLIKDEAIPIILVSARSPTKETQFMCLRLLCILCWYKESRVEVVKEHIVNGNIRSNGISTIATILSTASDYENTYSREEICWVVDLCIRSLTYININKDKHNLLVDSGIVSALLKVQEKGYITAKTMEFVPLILCMLSFASDLKQTLIEQKALLILNNSVKDIMQAFSVDSMEVTNCATNCCIFLYNMALENSLRKILCEDYVLQMISIVAFKAPCEPVTSALFCCLSMEADNRLSMSDSDIPNIISKFLSTRLDIKNNDDLVTTSNCCVTVLMLSKSFECRARVQQASIVPLLISLSKSQNDEICDSASQALNCLSASSKDSIEEGTVAALIAIALDGKSSNSVEKDPGEYLLHPEIPNIDFDFYSPPQKDLQISDFVVIEILAQKQPAGPAGKGPKPPNPPSSDSSANHHYADSNNAKSGSSEEEEMMGSEADGNLEEDVAAVDSIMMFAKMDLPDAYSAECSIVIEDEEDEDDDIEIADESPSILPNVESSLTQRSGTAGSNRSIRK